jgi:hypothetical protein
VDEATVLEHEDTAALRHYIDAIDHAHVVERGCAALQWFSAVLALGVVEIQVECKVRAFLVIRRLVGAVAMRFFR